MENLKVVILAAGRGKRLGLEVPKAVVDVCGKAIIEHQVEKLGHFVGLEQIYVVVGYKRDLVEKIYPNLNYVFNESYATTNTGKSLLKAIEKIGPAPVLWLNGDVFFDKEVLGKIIVKARQNDKSYILADDKKCGEEEIKYSLDASGNVSLISKEVKNPRGEALGINFVSSGVAPLLRKHLNLINDTDYFEKALENMILRDRVDFLPVQVGDLFCHEIDLTADLNTVCEYARSL